MSASPVITSTSRSPPPAANPARTASRTSACDHPSSATIAIVSTCPGCASSIWAVSLSNSVMAAPAGLSAVPNRAIPTSVASLTPAAVWNVVVSPTT